MGEENSVQVYIPKSVYQPDVKNFFNMRERQSGRSSQVLENTIEVCPEYRYGAYDNGVEMLKLAPGQKIEDVQFPRRVALSWPYAREGDKWEYLKGTLCQENAENQSVYYVYIPRSLS